jgi:two-component system OmpR family sensor kinase
MAVPAIRSKIIAASTLVFAAILVVFAAIVYRSIGESEVAKLDARLESQADKLSTELEEESDETERPDFAKLEGIRTGGLTDLQVRVSELGGGVLFAGDAFRDHPRIGGDGAGGRPGPGGPAGPRTAEFKSGGRTYRVVTVVSDPDDAHRFVVEVASPMTEIDARLSGLLAFFFISIPLALLLAGASIYLIVRAAFRPISGMVETAKSISAGSLDRRLRLPDTRDEVRALGETLNAMMDRIDAAFRGQKQFVADASHEVRTPLTVMTSELELALEHAADPRVQQSLRICLSEVERLTRLAEGLLLLARLDAGPPRTQWRPVRLDEVLAECVRRMSAAAAAKRITIGADLPDPVEILADEDHMVRVFSNLLDNAVKYSPPGSVVTVTLDLTPGVPREAVITIADNGTGIPAPVLPRIFERFFRGDEARGDGSGNGLGLAIVEQLVQLHGGRVSARSTPGEGSIFTIALPVGDR